MAWHGTLAGALDAAGGRALIFSNEFVDAFPFARWEWGGEGVGWRELRVGWSEGADGPMEVLGGAVAEAEVARTSLAERTFADALPTGQRVEVSLAYRRWMEEQLTGWERGRMLTIDYGEERETLYHRRPRGTLRAYCRQMRFERAEVYAQPSQHDLTADVNFTDLRRWGEELGLAPVGYGTQAEFLQRWLRATGTRVAADGRLAAMLDPHGAGGAFKVLEQTRQIAGYGS